MGEREMVLRYANEKQGIAASPYLPRQHDFNGEYPTARYQEFAAKAGCSNEEDVFSCLVSKDSMVLQKASNNVSSSQAYGTWAFLPVTDGEVVKSLPSIQLHDKKVNGNNILVGVSTTHPISPAHITFNHNFS